MFRNSVCKISVIMRMEVKIFHVANSMKLVFFLRDECNIFGKLFAFATIPNLEHGVEMSASLASRRRTVCLRCQLKSVLPNCLSAISAQVYSPDKHEQ